MRACLFARNRLALADGAVHLPSLDQARAWNPGRVDWFRVSRRGQHVRGAAAVAGATWTPPPGVSTVTLRTVLSLLPEAEAGLALTAAHLARWRRTSRFCGVCGTATVPSRHHQARVCPDCGHLAFPKISPAVIVQVTRGDRILLGRSRRHPQGSYSVLAGFVDPGENLEDAVRREVEEESGIRVRDIRYFGSQPWPFPDSLMVGFTATCDGDGTIVNRDDELEDVAWFTADALPPVPPAYSIARALIDDFARGHGVDPATVPTWQRAQHNLESE
ncbi:MAG: NAD(+) diphosphatase [Gemmatimonadota bacterium]|nr:NAD(+) diphosphatase [Gemmatimonadota bacterium]MDE2984305.1 NAD(+) diphosphatase [Gemmatimonadota bacterium]